MFGRRRPLLGAAVLVGASRSAARHEVEKQAQRDAERHMAIEQAADKKWREEKENDRRTQLAIEEAIAKEKGRAENGNRSTAYPEAVPTGYGKAYQMEQAPPYGSYGQPVGENQTATTQYCPNCGYACKRGDKFCSKCGQKQPIV